MLKTKAQEQVEISLQEFADYNTKIFYDATIPKDTYTPIQAAAEQHITAAELETVLKGNFKANKSTGLSTLPL
jgi:hypothetical protein